MKCMNEDRDSASTIGVVLYQRCFYITKACPEKSSEVTGKWPGKNGGLSIGWEDNIGAAWSCHVYAPVYALIYIKLFFPHLPGEGC